LFKIFNFTLTHQHARPFAAATCTEFTSAHPAPDSNGDLFVELNLPLSCPLGARFAGSTHRERGGLLVCLLSGCVVRVSSLEQALNNGMSTPLPFFFVLALKCCCQTPSVCSALCSPALCNIPSTHWCSIPHSLCLPLIANILLSSVIPAPKRYTAAA
jgi:hypothetical protein